MYSNFQNIHDTTITLLNFFLKLTERDTITLYLLIYSNSFLFCEVGRHYSLQWMKAMSVNFSKESTQIHKYKNIQYYKYAKMKTQAAVTNNN